MATVNFYIRNTKSDKKTPIHVVCYLPKQQRLRLATKYSIEPTNWDEKKQMLRNRIEISDIRDTINTALLDLKKFIINKIGVLNENNLLSSDRLRIEIDKQMYNTGDSIKENLSFTEYIDYFIRQSENRVKVVTIRSYKRTLEILNKYSQKTKKPLFFDSIDIDFYNAFFLFMDEFKYKINTKGKHFKNIKAFMNAANEDGYTVIKGHEHKYFKVLREDSYDIYLTTEELKEIKDIKYPLDSLKDNVRDWFLIGAYTGQRVSDWGKIHKDNFVKTKENVQVVKFKQTKTNTEVVIPIHPIVKEIFDKRNGNQPKKITEKDLNKEIKNIAAEAKINEPVPQANNELKYKLVSTHTARRSFCTNAYKAGLDSLAIMQLSGHKTEKNFLTYIKVEKEEFAGRIANHVFFAKK